VQAGHADVGDHPDVGPQERRGDLRLLGHGQIRRTSCQNENSTAARGDVPKQRDRARPWPFPQVHAGLLGHRPDRGTLVRFRPADQDGPLVPTQQLSHDAGHLVRSLPGGVDDLALTLSKLTMMIDARVSQVREGKVA